MTVSFRIVLLRRNFHGLRDDGQPDWPPSPTRLLGALISGAHSLNNATAARAGVAAVAASPAPIIDVPLARHLDLPGTYTEVTWTPGHATKGNIKEWLDISHVAIPTKSRTLKPQDAMVLAHDEIVYHVDVDLDTQTLLELRAAASQIPYFGRSHDLCEVYVEHSSEIPDLAHPQSTRRYPYVRSAGATRGWLPATVEWFDLNYERVFSDDTDVNRLPPLPATGYVQPLHYLEHQATDSLGTVVELSTPAPHHLIPEKMGKLHESLSIDENQFRLVPITQSTPPWGDGRLVGVGIFPVVASRREGVSSLDLEQLARAVDAALIPDPDQAKPVVRSYRTQMLDPGHWTKEHTRWQSSTPLRAFPDPRVLSFQLENEIADRFAARIMKLTLRREPQHHHDHRWSETNLADGFGQWWVELETDVPLPGPLQLGAWQRLGFGMFQPCKDKND